MANQILIKRGTGTSTLTNGELAYNTSTNTLYIGNSGNKAIGGPGAFLPLSGGTITGGVKITNSSNTGFLYLYGSAEGGNLQIQGPGNTHYWEMDALGNSQLRIYCHDLSDDKNYGFWSWNSDLSTIFPGKIKAPRAHFTNETDASETALSNVALRLGNEEGLHLDLDNNEIIAKNNATTMGTLYLQGLSIASGGIITKGTWQGSTIGISYGGTGATTRTEALKNLSAAKTAPQNISTIYKVLADTGLVSESCETLDVVKAMSNYSHISFVHTSDTNSSLGIVLSDAPTKYGYVVLQRGYSVNYSTGWFFDAYGDLYEYKYNPSLTTNNGWKKVFHSGNIIPIENGGTGAANITDARANLQVPHLDGAVINLGGNKRGIGLRTDEGGWWQFWNWGDSTNGYYASFAPTLHNQQKLGTPSMYISEVYASNYPVGTWNGDAIAIAKGGTGATNAATARSNLGITPANIGALATSGGNITGYLNFASTNTGLKWTTANGAEIHLRPYSPANVFQITIQNSTVSPAVSEYGALNISTNDGSITLAKPLGIAYGGTGSTSAASARTALGVLGLTGGTLTGGAGVLKINNTSSTGEISIAYNQAGTSKWVVGVGTLNSGSDFGFYNVSTAKNSFQISYSNDAATFRGALTCTKGQIISSQNSTTNTECRVTNNNGSLALAVESNRGIWDYTTSNWAIYATSSTWYSNIVNHPNGIFVKNSSYSGSVRLTSDNEGGNIILTSKSGTYNYQWDAYNDTYLRFFVQDSSGSVLSNWTYEASTGKFGTNQLQVGSGTTITKITVGSSATAQTGSLWFKPI